MSSGTYSRSASQMTMWVPVAPLGRGPDGGALAAVDRVVVDQHPRVVDRGQQLGGAVGAAVVDDDDLDVARVGRRRGSA